jgi:hypothetical protein
MTAYVAACRGVTPLTLTLSDALEATRIGLGVWAAEGKPLMLNY